MILFDLKCYSNLGIQFKNSTHSCHDKIIIGGTDAYFEWFISQ